MHNFFAIALVRLFYASRKKRAEDSSRNMLKRAAHLRQSVSMFQKFLNLCLLVSFFHSYSQKFPLNLFLKNHFSLCLSRFIVKGHLRRPLIRVRFEIYFSDKATEFLEKLPYVSRLQRKKNKKKREKRDEIFFFTSEVRVRTCWRICIDWIAFDIWANIRGQSVEKKENHLIWNLQWLIGNWDENIHRLFCGRNFFSAKWYRSRVWRATIELLMISWQKRIHLRLRHYINIDRYWRYMLFIWVVLA